MKYKAVFLVLIFSTILYSADYGKISGYVKDTNGNPLAGVNVYLKGTNLGTVSDSNGKYVITKVKPDTYKLNATSIGYTHDSKDITVNKDNNVSADFTLKETAIMMETVVVTASRKDKYLADTPTKVEVVSKNEIEKTSAIDVGDLVSSQLPATEVTSKMHARKTVKLQGLPSQYSLVLVDGERLRAGKDGADLSQVPIDAVERIEVIKGPASALYGSSALGGVVNIITKNPEDFKVSGSYSRGSYETDIYRLDGSYTYENIGLLVSASKYDTEGQLSWTQYTQDNLFMKLSLGRENRVYTSFNYFTDDRKWRNSLEKRLSGKIGGDYILSTTQSLSGSFASSYYERESESSATTSGLAKTEENEYKTNLQYSLNPYKNHFLIAGAEYLLTDYNSYYVDGDEYTASVYFQYDYNYNDIWGFVTGVRTDYHKDWDTQINPKLSILHTPFEYVTVRMSVGRGFKAPTLDQLHSTWYMAPAALWIQNNPDLEPEKSIGTNLNIEYYPLYNLTGNVTFFYNSIENKIVEKYLGVYEDGKPLYTYENKEEAETYGMEYSVRWSFLKHFLLKASYSYTEAVDKETNNQLPDTPKNKALAEISYSHEKLFADWFNTTLSFSTEYRDEKYYDSDNTEANRIDEKLIFNSKAILKFYDYISFSFAVDNIFNEDYEEFTQIANDQRVNETTYTATIKLSY